MSQSNQSYEKMINQLENFMKTKVDEKFERHLVEIIKVAKSNFERYKDDPELKSESLRQLVVLKLCH